MISVDDYLENMQEGQEKIYFIVNAQGFDLALKSPFMEPFKKSEVDVIILTQPADEFVFQNVGEYKGKRFVSIETNYEDI